MDEWDHMAAPQWSDFQSSHCADSYFEFHDETLVHQEEEDPSKEPRQSGKKALTPLSSNALDLFCDMDAVKMTPIRIVSPTGKNKENMVTETTYDDFLAKALSEFHLNSARRQGARGATPRKVSDQSDDVFYTPSDKYHTPASVAKSLMKMMKMKNSNPVKRLEHDFQEVDDRKLDKSVKKSPPKSVATQVEETKNLPEVKTPSKVAFDVPGPSEELAEEEEVPEEESAQKEEDEEQKTEVPRNLVTNKFTLLSAKGAKPKSKVALKVGPLQNRRLSMRKAKPEAKAKKPFVSMAEGVTKFQQGTPKRFRSTAAKDEKKAAKDEKKVAKDEKKVPTVLAKFAAKQLTQAKSPALRAKSRVRAQVLSQAEREEQEMQRIRANPIRARPARVSMKPQPLKVVPKKPPTVPEPFKLTDTRKTIGHTARGPTLKGASSIDLGQLKVKSVSTQDVAEEIRNLKLGEKGVKKAAGRNSCAGGMSAKNHRVPVVLGSDGGAICVQEKEVIHFGIRFNNQMAMNSTKTCPFSFDKRAKESQEKRLQKLKDQTNDLKKPKSDFCAKPAPTFKRSSSTPQLNGKDSGATRLRTTPQPFSFEERENQRKKQREELLKQAQELDKKARLFHANPVPNFKPVPVATSNFKVARKPAPEAAKNQPMKALHSVPNSDKTRASTFKRTVPKVELHSDKRARERREFDEKQKEKQRLEDEQKRKQAEERAAKQKEVDKMLRKQMELKARPVPEYKPIAAIKSTKPLTSPHSPALGPARNKND